MLGVTHNLTKVRCNFLLTEVTSRARTLLRPTHKAIYIKNFSISSSFFREKQVLLLFRTLLHKKVPEA